MSGLNKQHLRSIENTIGTLKSGDVPNGTQALSDTLSEAFNKDISVRVVPAKVSKQFFGMCVIPDESTLNKITESIMLNKTNLETLNSLWKKCNKWNLEIDENILSSKFSDREITAMLLHEIGHIVHTNSVPFRVSTIIQFELAKANVKDRSALGSKVYKNLIKIPIIHACTMGNTDSIKKELKADKFAVNCGYLDEMMSALTKVQQISGSSLSSDDSVTKATGLSVDTINAIRTRQANLARQNMSILRERLPKNYMRESVDEFIDTFLSNKDDVIYETTDNFIENYYTEFLGIGKHKLKPITQAQLDYIEAKLFDCASNDDKLMLLSYTNSKLELCEYYLDILNNKKASKKYIVPNSKNQLLRFQVQLNKLREKIINRKLPAKDAYVVFYPDGYEG